MITRRHLLTASAATATLLVSTHAQAHPVHASIAEVDVRDGHLEVSLRVLPEDLDEALSRFFDKKIRLERHRKVDPLIRRYLSRKFRTRNAEGDLGAVTFVGKQVELDYVWLYFEVALPEGTVGLENRVFFEIAPTQVNTALIRERGKDPRTLLFHLDAPVHAL